VVTKALSFNYKMELLEIVWKSSQIWEDGNCARCHYRRCARFPV